MKPFKKGATIGDLYHPAMEIQTKEEAAEYFEALVQFGMLHGQSREKATQIQKSNLGYFTGYYDRETAERVMRLFDCSHPIFGQTRPSAEEAFEAGRKMGRCDEGQSTP